MLKKYSLLIVLVVFTSGAVFAQVTPPGGHVPPPNTPVDGGLGLLLAIGVGYAIAKLKKQD